MIRRSRLVLAAGALGALVTVPASAGPGRTASDILKNSSASDWRQLDPESTLVMELKTGPVVIELSRRFAPQHVQNIRTLTREGYFSKSVVVRAQDNYVVQWGDPDVDAKDPAKALPLGSAKAKLPAELTVRLRGLPIETLPDRDEWAPITGFLDGIPVAGNPATDQAWIPHCYGVVGAGRDNPIDSSNGTSLYAVIGQAPRRLDLNITVVGRVVKGIEHLSTLPRGSGALGFYEQREQAVPLGRVRLLADIPGPERPQLEVLRTDTATWRAWIEAARNPAEPWFARRHDHTNVCNVNVPTRPLAPQRH